MFQAERLDGRTNYELRRTPVAKSSVVTGRETSRSSSAGGHLDRRRTVSQVHRVGHRDQHFARSLELLPAVRGPPPGCHSNLMAFARQYVSTARRSSVPKDSAIDAPISSL